jgi:predicted ribosome-associated RNA-binding protein Tma20
MVVKNISRLVLAAFAVFFLISLAGQANAQFSIMGKVISVDKSMKTITVEPAYPFKGSDIKGSETLTFSLLRSDPYDRDTMREAWVMMGNQTKKIGDIKAGDWVSVTYHQESSGLYVAEGVAISAPPAPRASAIYPATGSDLAVVRQDNRFASDDYRHGRDSRLGLSPFSLTGKVVSVDRNMLTIDTTSYSNSGGINTFVLSGSPEIVMGGIRKDLVDLKSGDLVTVNYHQERDGRIVADGIAIASPSAFLEKRTAISSSQAFSGKVVFIDHDAKTVTVEPVNGSGPAYSGGPTGAYTFTLDENASITMNNDRMDFRDLNVNDLVTVYYHEGNSGRIIADGIAVTTPALEPRG